jgi:hypothetical protein
MWILRLVRNFALLALLALAAHAAAGADKHQKPGHCGGPCKNLRCGGAACALAAANSNFARPSSPKTHGKTQLGQFHPRTTPTRQSAVACKACPGVLFQVAGWAANDGCSPQLLEPCDALFLPATTSGKRGSVKLTKHLTDDRVQIRKRSTNVVPIAANVGKERIKGE